MKRLPMKRLVALSFVALPFACTETPRAEDVCGEAQLLFQECGATLPMLTEGPCTATRRAVARCVTTHASNCEELAALPRRIDGWCASEIDGGAIELPPGAIPSSPARDGGKPTNDAAPPEPPPLPLDASVSPVDAGVDADVDAGAVFKGLGASGTVAKSEEKRYVTPSLPIGTYVVTLGGTGDADLYVKKSASPTTTSWDCRPFLVGSSESCAVDVQASTTLHVLVRGVATTSSFTISVLQGDK
jgi:hypothetical protein